MQIYTKKGDYTKTFLRYMRNAYDRYLNTDCDSIFKAYANPSYYKISAWRACKLRADSDVQILSYNTHKFTAAYITLQPDFTEWFRVETGTYIYEIPIQYVQ